MIRVSWVLSCCLVMASCHASDGESSSAEPGKQPAAAASAPTMLDRWNQLMEKGREFAESPREVEVPRVVPRGGRPEIILSGSSIRVNGQLVEIGGPLSAWKQALPPHPHCYGEVRIVCVWRDLGIEVATQSIANTSVLDASVHLAIPSTASPLPSNEATAKSRPTHAFSGYLELDGFGIDAQTKFSEVQARADPNRNLRCGLRDCSHPHGGFNEKASLYLRLSRADRQGNVVVLTLSGNEEQAPIRK